MPWSTLVAAFASRYGVCRRFSLPGFLRLCLARAQGSAVDLALPPLLSSPADDLLHISLQCPMLWRLALPQLPAADEARLAELVPRWPLLEHLELDAKPSSATFPALAEKQGRHCPKFASLKTSGAVKAEDAAALARWLPRLRSLCLDRSYMPRQELLAILARCRELKELSARGCVGFDDGDEEVARLRWLARFDVAGSRMVDEDELAGGGEIRDEDLAVNAVALLARLAERPAGDEEEEGPPRLLPASAAAPGRAPCPPRPPRAFCARLSGGKRRRRPWQGAGTKEEERK